MELHTPSSFNNESDKAGHKPVYLEGLINIIYLDEQKINAVHTIPDYGVSVSYLDYVVTGEEHAGSEWGSGLSRSMDPEHTATIGLQAFTKAIAREDHMFDCGPTENPAIELQKHISKQVFDMILSLSKKHKEEVSVHFPTGLDLELGADTSANKRKVISRILSAANMIASKGRRGPATFIMIGKDYVDYLRQDIRDDFAFQPMDTLGTMAYGMTIYVSAKLGNTVVVGRCSKDSTEPGIHLVTTHDDISGDIVITNNDISGVNAAYMLIETGWSPEKAYLQFNILDHVD